MPSPSIVEAERQARCERAARKTLDFPEQDGVAVALLNVGRPQSAQWRARQTMTDMSPTPEFREACRAVLGGDDPATVLGAIARGDQRIGEVREMHRRLVDATTAEERKELVESWHKQHEAVREAIRQGLRDGLTRGEIEEQMIRAQAADWRWHAAPRRRPWRNQGYTIYLRERFPWAGQGSAPEANWPKGKALTVATKDWMDQLPEPDRKRAREQLSKALLYLCIGARRAGTYVVLISESMDNASMPGL
jgi:hypothetical protein